MSQNAFRSLWIVQFEINCAIKKRTYNKTNLCVCCAKISIDLKYDLNNHNTAVFQLILVLG